MLLAHLIGTPEIIINSGSLIKKKVEKLKFIEKLKFDQIPLNQILPIFFDIFGLFNICPVGWQEFIWYETVDEIQERIMNI